MMDRRIFLTTVASLLAVPLTALTQQAGKVWRIGYLSPAPEHNPIDTAFDLAMRPRGYLEGQTLLVDRRYTGGRAEILRGFADELAGLNPDVIVAWSTAGALATKRATKTIPIVFLSVLDPIRLDMAASFAHPGGHMTGTSYDAEVEMYAMRLQLLKEAITGLSRVAVLGSAENIAFAPWTEMEKAARSLHLALQRQDLHGPAPPCDHPPTAAQGTWGQRAVPRPTLPFPPRSGRCESAPGSARTWSDARCPSGDGVSRSYARPRSPAVKAPA